MRVLVTGATGFVGLNTVTVLQRIDHDVTALTRESSSAGRLPADVDTVTGNVTDTKSLVNAMEGVDAVVHLAAVHSMYLGDQQDRSQSLPDRMETVNVEGTQNVITAAERCDVDSVVFASTYYAHPAAETNSNPYVRSKIEAGKRFTERDHFFDYSIIHPSNIMGPKDFRLNQFSDFWTVAANRLLIPPLYRPGGRNIVHVFDVANSIRFALSDGSQERYLVTGPNMSGREFYKRIDDSLATNSYILPFPLSVLDKVFAPIADVANERGIVSFDGSNFRNWSDSDIPAEHQNHAPIDQQPVQAIFDDTASWYVESGLL